MKMVIDLFRETVSRWRQIWTRGGWVGGVGLTASSEWGEDVCHLPQVPGLEATPRAEFESWSSAAGSKLRSHTANCGSD